MVGEDDPGVDVEGAWSRTFRTASRSARIYITNRSEARSSKLTVKNNVPPATRFAVIVRHAREYALENGGMRSRFSVLRLLSRGPIAHSSSRPARRRPTSQVFSASAAS
jgi:hypothetical protein